MIAKYSKCIRLIIAILLVDLIVVTIRQFSSKPALEPLREDNRHLSSRNILGPLKTEHESSENDSLTMADGSPWFHSIGEFEASYEFFQNFSVEGCSSNSSKLVVVIKSAPKNFVLRAELRQSWLLDGKKLHIKYFFVLGDPQNSTIMNVLTVEHDRNRDLIVGRFVDTYYNLTLKAIFTLNWMRTYCKHQWLFITDDDCLVNIANIKDLVDSKIKNDVHYNSTIYGQIFLNPLVNRKPSVKEYLPESIYPSKTLPDFATGHGYLMSPGTISKLLAAAVDPKTIPKLRFDDVYLTGIARQFANLTLTNAISHYITWKREEARAFAMHSKTATIVGNIGGRVLEIYRLSKNVQ